MDQLKAKGVRIMIILAVVLVLRVNSNEGIDFLLPDRTLQVSHGEVYERVTLIAKLDIPLLQLRPSFIALEKAYSKYITLGIFSDNNIKGEYFKAIEQGRGNLQLTQDIIGGLYKSLDQNLIVLPESTCVYYMPVLNSSTITEQSSYLMGKIEKVKTTWVPAEFKEEKVTLLERFIASYNQVGSEWYATAQSQSSNWNLLLSGIFPEGLLAAVEKLPCLEKTRSEKCDVIKCSEGKDGLYCELNFILPNKIKNYTSLIKINYGGAEISTKIKGHNFAQDQITQEIILLDCNEREKHISGVQLCEQQDLEAECKHALSHKSWDDVLQNCYFTLTQAPQTVTTLIDKGHLIQGENLIILQKQSNLFVEAPLVIYTNDEIQVINGDIEINIPANTITTEPRVITSVLSEFQITLIKTKAWWHDFKRDLDWGDYSEFAGMIVELILLPLTLLSVFLGLRNRYYSARSQTTPPHPKQVRRRNFRENRMLLKETENL